MNKKLRQQVLERDGERCILCYGCGTDLHHEPPKGMGGDKKADRPERLVTLCKECHSRRTGRIGCPNGEQEQYRQKIVGYLRGIYGPITQ